MIVMMMVVVLRRLRIVDWQDGVWRHRVSLISVPGIVSSIVKHVFGSPKLCSVVSPNDTSHRPFAIWVDGWNLYDPHHIRKILWVRWFLEDDDGRLRFFLVIIVLRIMSKMEFVFSIEYWDDIENNNQGWWWCR